jgi:endonuclease YncB( thermonuclease family)
MRGKLWIAAAALACAACSDATELVDSERVRVDGHVIAMHQLDAPDAVDGACPQERALGAQAEEAIRARLAGGDVTFQKTGMACLQFMECDGFVRVDGEDLGQWLIGEGLAVRAGIEGEPAHDWCATGE